MDEGILGIIAGIIITLGFFGAIAFAFYMNFRKRQIQSQEIVAAIEKGIEVPFPPPKKRNFLNQGIIWTMVGVVVAVIMGFYTESVAGVACGLLPVALGVAFLVIGFREEKRKAGEGEDT